MINNYLLLLMYDVSMIMNVMVMINEDFISDLVNYLLTIYDQDNKEIIKKILDKKKDLRNGDKIILNLPSDLEELVKYINGVIFDNKKMIKLFDSIGFEDTQKIASLAVDFVSYMYTINEMVYSKKIRN